MAIIFYLLIVLHVIGGLVIIISKNASRNAKQFSNRLESFVERFRCGDYESALQIAESFDRESSPWEYWAGRGQALLELGQLNEAEISLRNAISGGTEVEADPGLAPSELAHESTVTEMMLLGELNLERAEFDDAFRCFEEVLSVCPENAPSLRNMAELYLRRGDAPGQALRWATFAVKAARKTLPFSEVSDSALISPAIGLELGEALATLAWATAYSQGEKGRVVELASEAVALVDHRWVLESARIYTHLGMAYAVLRECDTGLQYFNQAVHIDPQGRQGRTAQKALRSIESCDGKLSETSIDSPLKSHRIRNPVI